MATEEDRGDELKPVEGEAKPVEGADDGEPDTKVVMIPKHRYDNAARLRREAEGRARQLQEENDALKAAAGKLATDAAPKGDAGGVEQLEAELVNLDREIAKAAADGETERQVELMGKARQLDRQLVAAQLEASVSRRIQDVGPATIEDMRYDDMVLAAEHDHPQINPDAEEYDEAKAAEVLEIKQAFESTGVRATAALEKALRYVFGEPAAPSKPAEAGRKPDARKAVAAIQKLPPDINGAGLDGDRAGKLTELPPVGKLSDADFAALPEEAKRRMRGDFV